ncbi:Transmembrane protein [Fulvia fulva]|uniref:Transmembrane protein n=1 Tax=Passalora fulva TaxID=5499 RepID=A0A9Q8UUI4_PASFU|nr:Transmembrane protein [Fulvia fulva]KAK4626672.1 Transmembrane protein [Fulvia fulva]KAK4628314.1 Transmembrane protein [Fulvia fulva]UJO22989.1 Transmembrane protein [Fulvia fulva]WPV13531.1 Transmembrane protein [Fulvia fulva]WPV28867.1 Transmembrane protein [Fulvia fulva]
MDPAPPSIWRWVIGFLMVGACWGLTIPFMRKAALERDKQPKASRPFLSDSNVPWIKKKVFGIIYAVFDLLRSPRYAIPLLLNVTGSVWFFLLIGQAELSLTVPITNSLAFLFTVLGEWYAEGKVISRDTWIGMGLVLGGIALCVHSKTS